MANPDRLIAWAYRAWSVMAIAMVVAILPLDASQAAISNASAATPGLSRADGQSEQRLLEVFGLMARGQNREALEKAGKLTADHPNFQLAQLVYGDLLAARMRPLQSVGDMPADMARAGTAGGLQIAHPGPASPALTPHAACGPVRRSTQGMLASRLAGCQRAPEICGGCQIQVGRAPGFAAHRAGAPRAVARAGCQC